MSGLPSPEERAPPAPAGGATRIRPPRDAAEPEIFIIWSGRPDHPWQRLRRLGREGG